uniref:AP-4 complex accessory subunit Tepsin n=1 Tax=Dromaius novaehollandiae TaxID=8790 RepID=A0A8C4J2W9_DRONO
MAAPLRDRLSFLSRLPTLLKGTADDEAPCPGYLFEEIAKISHESPGSSQCLLEYLLNRLQSSSCHVKLKVLKILLHTCTHGSPQFVLQLKRNAAFIREAAVFTGPPDPLHGNSLNQKVRLAAQDLASVLFSDALLPQPAALPACPLPPAGMGSKSSPCGSLQGFGFSSEKSSSGGAPASPQGAPRRHLPARVGPRSWEEHSGVCEAASSRGSTQRPSESPAGAGRGRLGGDGQRAQLPGLLAGERRAEPHLRLLQQVGQRQPLWGEPGAGERGREVRAAELRGGAGAAQPGLGGPQRERPHAVHVRHLLPHVLRPALSGSDLRSDSTAPAAAQPRQPRPRGQPSDEDPAAVRGSVQRPTFTKELTAGHGPLCPRRGLGPVHPGLADGHPAPGRREHPGARERGPAPRGRPGPRGRAGGRSGALRSVRCRSASLSPRARGSEQTGRDPEGHGGCRCAVPEPVPLCRHGAGGPSWHGALPGLSPGRAADTVPSWGRWCFESVRRGEQQGTVCLLLSQHVAAVTLLLRLLDTGCWGSHPPPAWGLTGSLLRAWPCQAARPLQDPPRPSSTPPSGGGQPAAD